MQTKKTSRPEWARTRRSVTIDLPPVIWTYIKMDKRGKGKIAPAIRAIILDHVQRTNEEIKQRRKIRSSKRKKL